VGTIPFFFFFFFFLVIATEFLLTFAQPIHCWWW